MIPEDLEEKIQATICSERIPFFVCTTCGTTVLGSFDPIDKIADVCDKHKLWLHVDVSILSYDLMTLFVRQLISVTVLLYECCLNSRQQASCFVVAAAAIAILAAQRSKARHLLS